MPVFDKPSWVQHGGQAIFSVDVHPSGQKLVTCGMDHAIRVWDVRPILSESDETDASVPKQLAVLSEHIESVNCARFSPDGAFIASGSGDKRVLIYELKPGSARALLGQEGGPGNVENWRPRFVLNGHTLDVIDLCWSPDSTRLASASLDNTVLIWDTATGGNVKALRGHNGFVKGVAWDPFGGFLASQGDDGVIVWRVDDWSRVAHIRQTFDHGTSAQFHMRLCWSPDGQTLACAGGMDKGQHICPLVARNTWQAGANSLAGHKGTVNAVRYNPVFHYACPKRRDGAAAVAGQNGSASNGGGDEEDVAVICALGASDRSFSVWSPAENEPITVGQGFFKKMVMDVAWTPDGRTLFVAGYDGSLLTVDFAEGELGKRVPDHEVQELIAQLYGDPKLRNQKGALPMAPELMQLEEAGRADVQREQRLDDRLGQARAQPAGPQGAAGPVTGVATATAGGYAAQPTVLVPLEPVQANVRRLLHQASGPNAGILGMQGAVELQASNTGRDSRGRPQAELVCLQGGQVQWADQVQGQVVAMAGSSKLAAVSTSNSDLMVYSAAGRRLFPPMRLGCPAARLACPANSARLLALMTDGQLRVWDFASQELVIETSVAPLLQPQGPGTQQATVSSVRLAASGAPVVVLSNAHAYAYQPSLKVWMRVADDAFPASAYTSNMVSSSTGGELSRLQADVAQRRSPHEVLAASEALAARQAMAARQEQAHLEHNMAAAAALQSPAEWRLWLLTYVRRLSVDQDEVRLRELIQELMGPVRWSPNGAYAAGPSEAPDAAFGPSSSSSALALPPSSSSFSAPASVTGRWQPTILGFDKRRLLRGEVLREVAKNRAHQQLVAEVLDQLKAIDAAQQTSSEQQQQQAAIGLAAPAPGQLLLANS